MNPSDVSLFVVPASGFRLDGGAMFGIVPKPLWDKTYPTDDLNRIELTTTTLLYRQGERSVLVDPGIGSAWDETFLDRYGVSVQDDALGSALQSEGLSWDSVTDVFLTHLHFDHVGGCFYFNENSELKLRFPNATHHVSRKQWEWGHAPTDKDKGSYIREHLDLLASSGRLALHESGWELMPGFKTFEVDGHTRGQQLCRIEAGERTWVYGGDLFALADHLRPAWVMAYDIEPLETLAAKQAVLREQLSAGEWLILGHDTRIVAGQIDAQGKRPQLSDMLTRTGSVQPLETA